MHAVGFPSRMGCANFFLAIIVAVILPGDRNQSAYDDTKKVYAIRCLVAPQCLRQECLSPFFYSIHKTKRVAAQHHLGEGREGLWLGVA